MKKVLRTYSGTMDQAVSVRETANRAVARKAAAEGVVLLKNDGVLPLDTDRPVALLGTGAVMTIKGGTGSGDVNTREIVNIYQGMVNAGFDVTTSKWLNEYQATYHRARLAWRDIILGKAAEESSMGFFGIYAAHQFSMPEGREVAAADIGAAKTAVYVISRVAGEAADRSDVSGDYYLSDFEKRDLEFLAQSCDDIIVLLNTGAQIDMKFIHSIDRVRAIVLISQPGMEGGNAVADVLQGKVTPSGKLTDTWAVNYEDFPNSATFSHNNGNIMEEYYEEGIYVGYRYFDSFGVKAAYPFGYGLSYTDFVIRAGALSTDNASVSLEITVRNTGGVYSGKEVAQIYVSCPQGGLPKELRRLCGFKKTAELAPGEEERMTLTFPVKELASFSEEQSAWIVEKGDYAVWLGSSSADTQLVGVIQVAEDAVIETVRHICPLQDALDEIVRPGAAAAAFEQSWKAEAAERGIAPVQLIPAPVMTENLPEDEYDRLAWEIVDSVTDSQLAEMVIGELSRSQNAEDSEEQSALGSAGKSVPGAAAETCCTLENSHNVAPVVLADGPAGLRLSSHYWVSREDGSIITKGFLANLEGGLFAGDGVPENVDTYYQYCTAFPVGVMLAQTWDPELVAQVGKAVAVELHEFGVSWWLAPGMNIHRNPLCGRNFEYYSEDPLVAGVIAAAMTNGVQSVGGVGTTIKHYACNNQEDNRYASNSRVSERAMREIYLKGFEIAIKSSQPMAIMTSYNLINGVHAANSWDICTQTAREEWGFAGVIMTDWLTTTSGSRPATAPGCINAGNDLIMPGVPSDKPNILAALESGELSREQLRLCVKRIIKLVFQTLAYEDSVSYSRQFVNMKPYLNS